MTPECFWYLSISAYEEVCLTCSISNTHKIHNHNVFAEILIDFLRTNKDEHEYIKRNDRDCGHTCFELAKRDS